ncbi:MAG TPA: TolC family protein [Terriglobales bacterium]|nr:TolC family protein [Terriglobales bacterium]
MLTLTQAAQRARANSVAFQAAVTAVGTAQDVHTQARAALFPALSNQDAYYFTQDNVYVANDGPHEFVTWGDVRETLDWGSRAAVRQARAGVALAQAQQDIASRGLFATVVQDYFTLASAGRKLATARQALADAQQYLKDSEALENAGQAAHADVIQAQLQVSQRVSGLAQAQQAQEDARLGLAVLLFPTFNQNFSVVDTLDQPPPLPPEPQVLASAGLTNPIMSSAKSALVQAKEGVTIAHAALLPSASLSYTYGIDAHEYALFNQYHRSNLGSAVTGTLSIPLFDWGANRAKLHMAQLAEKQSERALSSTQRQLQASLIAGYDQARTAYNNLAQLANSRDLAAESLRLVALRYRDGEATILELVSAQDALVLARDAYDNGQVDYRVALANLQTLTGTY